MLVPIILGSSKDMEHGMIISNGLHKHGIQTIIRICSAHKHPEKVLSLIKEYDNNTQVHVFVTVAGKSNALSALIDGNVSLPVISCPPLKHETMYDLYSSTSMPTDIAPLVVLNPKNAVMAVLKIHGLVDPKFRLVTNEIHKHNRNMLNIDDIRFKYNINSISILNRNNTSRRDGAYEYMDTLQRNGKIRDIYSIKNYSGNSKHMLGMVATDRLSSFDRVLTTIPFKGMVLNSISNWWFQQTKHIVPNHAIESNFNELMIVRKCYVFPIEFVVRAYMTGSTQTSIWQNYNKGVRNYCGHELRDGYNKNDKLDNIILTPTTKSDISDELISEREIIEQNFMTSTQWNICKKYALELFKYGQRISNERGLILVDTKYEFGIGLNGEILLIDELHTPDSSRYWFKHSYQERINKGLSPENMDKEIIRRWIKEKYDNPYTTENIIIPDELRLQLSSVYLQLHELITDFNLLDKLVEL